MCPTFQVPVGTGHLIAGGNANIVEENYIFDNWRRGTMLHWVPAALRGEQDAAKTYDTSANNQYLRNCMGTRPIDIDNVDFSVCEGHARTPTASTSGGTRRRARTASRSSPAASTPTPQFGNCWAGNRGFDGQAYSSDPPALLLPACPGLDVVPAGQLARSRRRSCRARRGTRSTTRTRPGCDWFTTPPEPSKAAQTA